jgi:hypothetical protein
VDEPVHWAHFLDGYPLCWPMDRDGEFVGTRNENEVTCPQCRRLLTE